MELELDFRSDSAGRYVQHGLWRPARAIAAVRTQIHFADGSKFDAPVDYCKVTNLYIHDDKLTWD